MLIVSFKQFFKNPSLPAQAIISVIYDYYFLFLPVIFFEFLQSQSMTALGYAFVYGVSGILLMHRRLSEYLLLYVFVIALMGVFIIIVPDIHGYAVAVTAALTLMIRDALQSNFQSDLSKVSQSPAMFGVLVTLSLILIPILSQSINIAFSFATSANIQMAFSVQVGLAVILMVMIGRQKHREKKTESLNVQATDKAKFICWYSLLYNATSFPVRMIVTPLIVYTAAKELGYDDQAISITGSVIGFVALMAMLLRFLVKTSSLDSVTMMKRYYLAGLMTMMMMVALSISLHQGFWAQENIKLVVGAVVLLHLSLEVTGRLWSIGFSTTLRMVSHGQGGDPALYRAGFARLMMVKNIGSATGFVLFAISTAIFSNPYSIFLLGSTAMVFMLATVSGVKSWKGTCSISG